MTDAMPVLRSATTGALLARCGPRVTSGFLLEDMETGLVLVPGLLLNSELASLLDKAAQKGHEALRKASPRITVLVRRHSADNQRKETVETDSMAAYKSAIARPDDLVELQAEVVALWRWTELHESLPNLLSEWTLSREDGGVGVGGKQDDGDSAELLNLLSLFLVVQLKVGSSYSSEKESWEQVMRRVLSRTPPPPPRGAGVCLSSAPLGSPALLGAISVGVVSGLSPGGLLLLTDARAAPGSEGAPLYPLTSAGAVSANALPAGKGKGNQPVALVLCPLSWCRGEFVGFTLCLPLSTLLQTALSDLENNTFPSVSLFPDKEDNLLWILDRSVLVVRAGHLWGSGIVVDKQKRILLTCAHVVGEHKTAEVRWLNCSGTADVVWGGVDGVPFDVAVLRIRPGEFDSELEQLHLDDSQAVVGETVWAAGYPLFPELAAPDDWSLRPLVTRGQVSGWWPSAPSQVLTSCCVQSGASGGPLLRVRRSSQGCNVPAVMGMLVCNAQLGTGRDAVVYPHVNIALATSTFLPPLNNFLRTGDKSDLEVLQSESNDVKRQWQLKAPHSSKL